MVLCPTRRHGAPAFKGKRGAQALRLEVQQLGKLLGCNAHFVELQSIRVCGMGLISTKWGTLESAAWPGLAAAVFKRMYLAGVACWALGLVAAWWQANRRRDAVSAGCQG